MSICSLSSWKQILRTNFTNWSKLADFLELSEEQRSFIFKNPRFVLNLPYRLAEKIEKQTLDDPILKQFLPLIAETVRTPSFLTDPVGDQASRRTSKLLHKYRGRVLLVTTSSCAMHCRYCFRQNFEYETVDKSFDEELDYIRKDTSIKEVILSGGDPLSLSDRVLEPLLLQVSSMSHVKRIRFHSRFPIGIPERIDDGFLRLIEQIPQQVWFIIHSNHPRELDEDVFAHLHKLQKRGVIIGNQAVLLKDVNDDVETLAELCEKLADRGILPYYLHQLDQVQGAKHFEISPKEGLAFIKELRERLPGYAVPKYVKEVAGEKSKTPVELLIS